VKSATVLRPRHKNPKPFAAAFLTTLTGLNDRFVDNKASDAIERRHDWDKPPVLVGLYEAVEYEGGVHLRLPLRENGAMRYGCNRSMYAAASAGTIFLKEEKLSRRFSSRLICSGVVGFSAIRETKAFSQAGLSPPAMWSRAARQFVRTSPMMIASEGSGCSVIWSFPFPAALIRLVIVQPRGFVRVAARVAPEFNFKLSHVMLCSRELETPGAAGEITDGVAHAE
jgi:hypothetical protein